MGTKLGEDAKGFQNTYRLLMDTEKRLQVINEEIMNARKELLEAIDVLITRY